MKIKQILVLCCATALLFGAAACAPKPQEQPPASLEEAPVSEEPQEEGIRFVDADGREIELKEPPQRIVSFYSAHTENIYSLGAGDKLIGVYRATEFPPEAADKEVFDYKGDPEKTIAAEPDLVLVRPVITRQAPDFVAALETAGIPVVSLYPDTFEDFDNYILTLGKLTGTEEVAAAKLDAFHQQLSEISAKTAAQPQKPTVFFEATENELRTVIPTSMAGRAIQLAGGGLAVPDAEPISPGGSIAAFGTERLLEIGDTIDVYLAQRGPLNAAVTAKTIAARPGFDTVAAVQQGKILLLSEKLIASPTFRYATGVRELARYLYPNVMDDLSAYQASRVALRRDLANLLVLQGHLPVYVPDSGFYPDPDTRHVYGGYQDAGWKDADFDAIETVTAVGYMSGVEEDGKEFFLPETQVTREELAYTLHQVFEVPAASAQTEISDLVSAKNQKEIQQMVDAGIFALENGAFNPSRTVTTAEILDALQKGLAQAG